MSQTNALSFARAILARAPQPHFFRNRLGTRNFALAFFFLRYPSKCIKHKHIAGNPSIDTMKFNVSALAMAAVLSAGATSTVTLAFAPSSSANHHHPSLAVSSFGRPAFVAQRQSPSDEFILHMVGGGKDEEAAENLNEYKKNISSKRITEASGKSGEVRTLLLRRTHQLTTIFILFARYP